METLSGIRHALKGFGRIGLEDMDGVKLMNRKENKYVLRCDDLASMLIHLQKEYFVVEIAGQNVMPYQSRYYDFPRFDLYTAHQNGKLNRYKIRSRTYMLTGTTFLECKFKSNKKWTSKERIRVNMGDQIADYMEFLGNRLPFSPVDLEEKIQINYNRITLVDKSFSGRITIDTDLEFSSSGKIAGFENLAIIEVKRKGPIRTTVLESYLKERGIKPFPISKYCLGISRLYSGVKKNRINRKTREIQKVLNTRESALQQRIV